MDVGQDPNWGCSAKGGKKASDDGVYNTQNYWVFRLSPSSGILKTRKHNVSETESVSVFR
jgi:hypothetical protein